VSAHPQRRPDIDVTPAADGYLVRVPGVDAVTWLNRTGYLVMQLCTGENSDRAIAEALNTAFHLNWLPLAPVQQSIAELVTAGLVRPGSGATAAAPKTKLEIVLWAPGPTVSTDVATRILTLRNEAEANGIHAVMTFERDRSIRTARNRATNRVMRDTSVSMLLLVDATAEALDAVLELGLGRLVGSAHEVIGIPVPWPTPAWDRALEAAAALPGLTPWELNVYARGYDVSFTTMPERAAEDGFLEARHCGSSAMLIRRSALERMAGADVVPRNRGAVTQGAVFTDPGWGFFDPARSKDHIDLDEDLAFGERLRGAGVRIMVDVTGAFGTCVKIAMRLQAAKA
jgi:hypothetical protein